MYGYVYLTTNNITGKKYIGQHKSNSFDTKYYGSGIYIRRAIEKYGIENFDCQILCECFSREELNEKEQFYIDLTKAISSDDYYNIAKGGEGGDIYSCLSDESKKEMSSKISSSLSGKPKSEEHKKKISEARIKNGSSRGERNGMYGSHRAGALNPNYGKHYYNDGTNEVLIYECVYENEFKDKGFIKGRLKSKLDALHKDASKRSKGCVYIYKGDKVKKINPEQLNVYIDSGWIKGRPKRDKQLNKLRWESK